MKKFIIYNNKSLLWQYIYNFSDNENVLKIFWPLHNNRCRIINNMFAYYAGYHSITTYHQQNSAQMLDYTEWWKLMCVYLLCVQEYLTSRRYRGPLYSNRFVIRKGEVSWGTRVQRPGNGPQTRRDPAQIIATHIQIQDTCRADPQWHWN